ncbi:1,4-alpha-glucan-branching enzyme [Trema orientale]|uniref:1,4-alpha-glucan-branching enzyme n=1 Tax=Trema orientale TaxID=63057 RepID=A0A2P5D7R8_TREOI|nr:1,4-alpha-glucan-branching enzyme [Trema orientale]
MASSGIKGGYWASWAAQDFPANRIPHYFTHNFYAFIQVHPTTFELVTPDPDQALMRTFTSTLRSNNSSQKAFLSIGGGGGGGSEISDTFSRMASDGASRAKFINSTIDVARRYNFDGLDLDWEYPKNQDEMSRLSDLLREWHVALVRDSTSHPSRLLLSAAVYYRSDISYDGTHRSYPSNDIKDYLDFINVMSYDLYGSWANVTGEHALLFDRRAEWAPSISRGIQSWIDSGVPRNKLVMGLPLYGHSWELADPNVHGVGAPTVGPGRRPGPGDDDGIVTYNRIVQFNRDNNAHVEFDDTNVAVYSYAGRYWIGYDDPRSIARKVEYAKGQNLGGFFFWALGNDYNWQLSQTAVHAWDE